MTPEELKEIQERHSYLLKGGPIDMGMVIELARGILDVGKLLAYIKELESRYPLRDKESRGTFTVEGQRHARGGDIVLLPLNPYDPTDPNNPPEFRNPFIHEGRVAKIGDQMFNRRAGEIVGRVSFLLVDQDGAHMQILVGAATHEFRVGNPNYTFADSRRKKTYLWAYPAYDIPGSVTIELKRMTKEEGEKTWGAKIVPGSEEE